MGTFRKSQREILRRRYGSKLISSIYRDRKNVPQKKQCAFVRGIKALANIILGRW